MKVLFFFVKKIRKKCSNSHEARIPGQAIISDESVKRCICKKTLNHGPGESEARSRANPPPLKSTAVAVS